MQQPTTDQTVDPAVFVAMRGEIPHFVDTDINEFRVDPPLADGTLPVRYVGEGKSYPRTSFITPSSVAFARRWLAGEV